MSLKRTRSAGTSSSLGSADLKSGSLGFNSSAVVNGAILIRTPSLTEAIEEGLGSFGSDEIEPHTDTSPHSSNNVSRVTSTHEVDYFAAPAALTRSGSTSSKSSAPPTQHKHVPIAKDVRPVDDRVAALERAKAGVPGGKRRSSAESKEEQWLAALPASLLEGKNALRYKSVMRALKAFGVNEVATLSEETIREKYREWRNSEAPKRRALRQKKNALPKTKSKTKQDSEEYNDGNDEDEASDTQAIQPKKQRKSNARAPRAERINAHAPVGNSRHSTRVRNNSNSAMYEMDSGSDDDDEMDKDGLAYQNEAYSGYGIALESQDSFTLFSSVSSDENNLLSLISSD